MKARLLERPSKVQPFGVRVEDVSAVPLGQMLCHVTERGQQEFVELTVRHAVVLNRFAVRALVAEALPIRAGAQRRHPPDQRPEQQAVRRQRPLYHRRLLPNHIRNRESLRGQRILSAIYQTIQSKFAVISALSSSPYAQASRGREHSPRRFQTPSGVSPLVH